MSTAATAAPNQIKFGNGMTEMLSDLYVEPVSNQADKVKLAWYL